MQGEESMTLIAICTVLMLVVPVVAAALLVKYVFPEVKRLRLESAIFGTFAHVLRDPKLANVIAVESEWVALRYLRLPEDAIVWKLSKRDRAQVYAAVHDINQVGVDLIGRGYLRYFETSFDTQGKNQKILPPKSVFLLTKKGLAEVLRYQVKEE